MTLFAITLVPFILILSYLDITYIGYVRSYGSSLSGFWLRVSCCCVRASSKRLLLTSGSSTSTVSLSRIFAILLRYAAKLDKDSLGASVMQQAVVESFLHNYDKVKNLVSFFLKIV